MSIPHWSPKSPDWSEPSYNLLLQIDAKKISAECIEHFIEKSNNFPVMFPVETVRCKFLQKYVDKDTLERNINSVYPLIHERALELYCRFIAFKSKHGNTVERKLYENMDLLSFVDRLLTKRAVMFMGKFDKYLLLDGRKGSKNWEVIGTDKEVGDLKLENCLSYDEIKLSVFLSVSSYTYFVNVGDRKNMAKFTDNRSKIQDEGIIVGMIGPRMKKDNVMEYQEIVFSAQQNTKSNGYGKNVSNSVHRLFSEFYEEDCLDYKECEEFRKSLGEGNTRFTNLKSNCFFDNHYYYKRLAISFDTLLIEANSRALVKDTTAYIHVVGLGLGVWKISPHQKNLYVQAFAERLSALGQKLKAISDICLSYINVESCGGYKHGEIYKLKGHPLTGIRIHIYKRNPHTKLTDRDEGKLLVISYAWDGNSLPGNEFWSGKLGSSGDSAAASSTQIAEIHNPHINPAVCSDNLQVVTEDGIVTFSRYQDMIRVAKAKRKF